MYEFLQNLPEEPESLTGEVDLRGEVCPYTLVKTKHAIAEVSVGETLLIRFDNFASASGVPAALRREGQEVVSICEDGAGEWLLEIRRKH